MKEYIKEYSFTLIIGLAIGIIIMQIINIARINKIDNLQTIYEIKILNEYINVRTQPTIKAKKIYEVVKDEKYRVVEVFEEETFSWYKIVFSDRRTGWIASSNDKVWVEVIK